MGSLKTLKETMQDREAFARSLANSNLGVLRSDDSRTTVSVWDAICEGPIEGLVDGNASVFLNNDPMVEANSETYVSNSHVARNSSTIALTNGSKNAVISPATANIASYVGKVILLHGTTTATGISGAIGSTALTISGGIENITSPTQHVYSHRIHIAGANKDGSDFVAKVRTYNSTTSVLLDRPLQQTISGKTAILDKVLGPVATASGTQNLAITMANWAYTTGSYSFSLLSPAWTSVGTRLDAFGDTKKTQRGTLQFRTGHSVQEPIKEIGDLQGSSIARTSGVNTPLELVAPYKQLIPVYSRARKNADYTNEAGTANPSVFTSVGTGTGGLGLANSKEVDELVLNFQYQSLFSQHYESGEKTAAYAAYELVFKYTRGSVETSVTLPIVEHTGKAIQGFSVDTRINLESYQPFDSFKIQVSRITASTGMAYKSSTWKQNPLGKYTSNNRPYDSKGYIIQAKSKLNTITSIIKYKLSYPYTAYSAVTFDSKAYPNIPTRSYHLRGKLVKVPANYITREEASDGVAIYNRESNGAVNANYQDWDGTFRNQVYTNNPAWILYDLLESKRYGLGRFSDSVDKWSFYRVGLYCDELVDDGKGGLEPRYTCNLYLGKATSARKVISDLATTFIGILHWLDGEIYLTNDKPSSPVYAFGNSNIIRDTINYATTDFKKRPNQYVVIYNNPKLDYQQDYVLVEDTADILERGIVLSKDTVAFGCTSEGQAERFGRWKLFTSKLQTETLSFSTSVNASFLNPGDTITVQDADRQNKQLSGRIASSGTVSTTVISLDRNVVLLNNHAYTLNVMFFTPAAILVDESATINSVDYVRGDVILTDNSGTALTEVSVNNLRDTNDSNRNVTVDWNPNNHVQSKPVSTGVGSTNIVTVSSAFSAAPNRETMWSLTSRNNNIIQGGSSKVFRVYSVVQEEGLTWSITATEHSNQKYKAIESNFNLVKVDLDFVGALSTDLIPTVQNLSLSLESK